MIGISVYGEIFEEFVVDMIGSGVLFPLIGFSKVVFLAVVEEEVLVN